MKHWLLLVLVTAPTVSIADVFEAAPTDGVALPTAPLAGELDGRVVATNPGGTSMLRGTELALALDYQRDIANSAGRNVGLYLATPFGGDVLPKLGIGGGVDWLHSAGTLTPDPGNRVRFTLSSGIAVGRYLGLGIAWRRFRDDGLLDRVTTFDVGLAFRPTNRFAVGTVIRDIGTPTVADKRVARRYELEAVVRPLSTDVFELAIGSRLAGGHNDWWGRASVRVLPGLFAHTQIETRSTMRLDDVGGATDGRDVRLTAGFEVSFGSVGATTLVTGVRGDRGSSGLLGGSAVVRLSKLGPASVLPRRQHIERVELAGKFDLATLRRLRMIERDPSVTAVVIVIGRLSAGPASRDEVRAHVEALRRSGKRVFAHLLAASQAEYYIASAAERVYVDPAVDLDIVGMAVTKVYMRGALDKLRVFPQFLKIDEFKDAPEVFTESGPSAPSSKQTNELVDSVWDNFLSSVARSRGLAKAELAKLIDGGPYTVDSLVGSKLIDGVATDDELEGLVAKELGRHLAVTTSPPERPRRWNRSKIAIIRIDGSIVRGKSPPPGFLGGGSSVGDETIVDAIRSAREDATIDAIVLRVNSPGGDAIASELIFREVFATRGKKPIICSLGDYAASGGYFVSAGCDQIIAEPTTITGSIGVFAGKLDISGSVSSLGISTVTTLRGVRGGINDGFSLPFFPLPLSFRPWNDDERAALMVTVRHAYDRFVGAVAKGRGLQRSDVDTVGRGRVWTGAQGLDIKLVDRLGGVNDAIDEAARRAGTPDDSFELVEMPKTPGLLEWLRGASSVTSTPIIERQSVIHARLPLELVW